MGFVFDEKEAKWQYFFEALQAFKTRTGHCLVPRLHWEGDCRLGEISYGVRTKGYYIHDRPDRRRQLEDIGFPWDSGDLRYLRFYKALSAFQARVGHCRVPLCHDEGGYKLGKAMYHL